MIVALLLLATLLGPTGQYLGKHTALDLMPTFTSSIGTDEKAQPGNDPFVSQDLRLSYRLSEDLGKRFSFTYYHNDAIDQSYGRVFVQGKAVYPPSFRDRSDTESLTFLVSPNMQLSGGYYYQYRSCCGAAGDPHNLYPVDAHTVFLSDTLLLLPQTQSWPFSLSYTAKYGYAEHHITPAFIALLRPGLTDHPGHHGGVAETLKANAALNKSKSINGFASFTWGSFIYTDNDPLPQYHDLFVFGLLHQLGNRLSLSGEIDNQTQRPQGGPYPAPNELHFNKAVIILTYNLLKPAKPVSFPTQKKEMPSLHPPLSVTSHSGNAP